jgi:hypothetical protein
LIATALKAKGNAFSLSFLKPYVRMEPGKTQSLRVTDFMKKNVFKFSLILISMLSQPIEASDTKGPHGGEIFESAGHALEWVETNNEIHVYDLTPEAPSLPKMIEIRPPKSTKQKGISINLYFRDIDGTLPHYMTNQSGTQINTFHPQSAAGFQLRFK